MRKTDAQIYRERIKEVRKTSAIVETILWTAIGFGVIFGTGALHTLLVSII